MPPELQNFHLNILHVDIPENCNIAVREKRRVDLQSFIGEIVGVQIRGPRGQLLPRMSPLNGRSATEFSELDRKMLN